MSQVSSGRANGAENQDLASSCWPAYKRQKHDGKDQRPYAYGNNVARLLNARKHFDPAEIFTSATPLRRG